jgi:prepilin signal peptidase PulO-like enzyme (type II secretory pathway)
MNYLTYLFLFFLGAVFGSFLDVLAMRYKENEFILSKDIIFGRSKCSYCHQKLKWYELIPILSFIFQAGKCRNCGKKLSLEYPLVEILSGLVFVFVPIFFKNNIITFFSKTNFNLFYFWGVILIWDLILLTLILIALIDFRLKIIPNETIIFLLILGIILNILILPNWNNFYSFLGQYKSLFFEFNNLWQNKLIAAFLGFLFFLILVLITLGRGMGMGDVKLIFALGFIFGWPEIILITILSFVFGGIVGLFLILIKKSSFKDLVPFGPFIVLASFLTFFIGAQILDLYFLIASKIFNL